LLHTPSSHEDGNGDRGVVIKDAGESGEVTTIVKMSIVTESVTFWTSHVHGSRRVADVIPIDR